MPDLTLTVSTVYSPMVPLHASGEAAPSGVGVDDADSGGVDVVGAGVGSAGAEVTGAEDDGRA